VLLALHDVFLLCKPLTLATWPADSCSGSIIVVIVVEVFWCFVCRRRERLVKFLRSNQVQTFLCSVVLLDACIIVAQILLDINSVKGDFLSACTDLLKTHSLYYVGRNNCQRGTNSVPTAFFYIGPLWPWEN